MKTVEAFNLMESTCLSFMVHIPRDVRPKILEAAEILKNIIDEIEDEKKDE